MTAMPCNVPAVDTELALLAEYGDGNLDNLIPPLSRDTKAMGRIEAVVQRRPTSHELVLGDSRKIAELKEESVHLVVTSPPYWTLKRYNENRDQLGHVEEYTDFVAGLDQVWQHCFRALVPGGRLICVVGDVCLSRRKNNGRHTVVPLHATIQEHCKEIGFDNLSPIIWHKIANANYEVTGGGGFLGKPYEPNAVIKNDIEFILMQRKPGGYRKPSRLDRLLSIVPADRYQEWFRQIWHDVTGASTADHPAPYPLILAERLVRMFSFVGDTVLDPFMGTATTNLAAARWGRNSIGIEVDRDYYQMARKRMAAVTGDLYFKGHLALRRGRDG
jgi:modification methylase